MSTSDLTLAEPISAQRRRRDRLASVAINAAGIGVIVLLLFMLLYLLSVSWALGEGVRVGSPTVTQLDGSPSAKDLRVVANADGRLWTLPDSAATVAARIAAGGASLDYRNSGSRLFLRSEGGLQVYTLREEVLPGDAVNTPVAHFESTLLEVLPAALWDAQSAGRESLVVGLDSAGNLRSWLLDDVAISESYRLSAAALKDQLPGEGELALLIDLRERRVLLFRGEGFLDWRLQAREDEHAVVHSGRLAEFEAPISALGWGPSRETLLVVDAAQMLVRYDAGRDGLPRLGPQQALNFAAVQLRSEQRRRVTYLVSASGELQVRAPSSGQLLFQGKLDDYRPGGRFLVADDGGALLLIQETQVHRWPLENAYPETGWRALWSPQWYSRYEEAARVWHPDGAAIGVLSKLNLTPLLYGTFKAALYGMLMAIPLAFGAAIYTGYFLSSRARNRIKPAIELLEAFPTVVLGFIAGLWLAPLLVDYLVLLMLLPLILFGIPLLLAALHLLLQNLSPHFSFVPPRAWIVALAYVSCLALSLAFIGELELFFFDGSVRDWLWREFQLHYDQRNALLVGLAMGLALTPTLFSIIEDAIHAVPSSLSDASLALGATRWQSLALIVLPAAAPAVLSALLIGLSRGLGETMIVLLATGNTPLMDPGLFSGMRSISASIASELPEAGPGTVHFRLLFLASLVLFALTFVFNTIAELFRQRLRYSYAGR